MKYCLFNATNWLLIEIARRDLPEISSMFNAAVVNVLYHYHEVCQNVKSVRNLVGSPPKMTGWLGVGM